MHATATTIQVRRPAIYQMRRSAPRHGAACRPPRRHAMRRTQDVRRYRICGLPIAAAVVTPHVGSTVYYDERAWKSPLYPNIHDVFPLQRGTQPVSTRAYSTAPVIQNGATHGRGPGAGTGRGATRSTDGAPALVLLIGLRVARTSRTPPMALPTASTSSVAHNAPMRRRRNTMLWRCKGSANRTIANLRPGHGLRIRVRANITAASLCVPYKTLCYDDRGMPGLNSNLFRSNQAT